MENGEDQWENVDTVWVTVAWTRELWACSKAVSEEQRTGFVD